VLHTIPGNIFYTTFGICYYLYVCYCLREIARKQAFKRDWLAWVPLANLYVASRLIGHGIGWTILYLVPIVDIVFLILLIVKMARLMGRSGWLGVLILIPIVDLFVAWEIAFGHRRLRPSKVPTELKTV
jgi:Family of unknown function (DUF5684)